MKIDYWTRCGLDGGNSSTYIELKSKEYDILCAYARGYKEGKGRDIDGYTLSKYLEEYMPKTYQRILREVGRMVKQEMSQWGIKDYNYGFDINDKWAKSFADDEE